MAKYLVAVFGVFICITNLHAQNISAEDWIKSVENGLPGYFCQEEQYFRQCFEISGSHCLETAREIVSNCIDKEKENFPDSFNKVTGEQWGNIIGTCAGNLFEMKHSAEKSKNPKCYNPAHWM